MADRNDKEKPGPADLRLNLDKVRQGGGGTQARGEQTSKDPPLVEIEANDAREKAIWEKYLFSKIIGKGGFSVVISLCDKKTKATVAAKVVEKHKLSSDTLRLLQEEPIILRSLDHPNIMPLLDFVESQKRLFLFFQYMRGGDLSKYIKDRRKHQKFFTEGEIQVVMRRLLEAIAYLHSRGIIHRDIKPGERR
jgi:serine/threonine-protein kinase ULK/ATG1